MTDQLVESQIDITLKAEGKASYEADTERFHNGTFFTHHPCLDVPEDIPEDIPEDTPTDT